MRVLLPVAAAVLLLAACTADGGQGAAAPATGVTDGTPTTGVTADDGTIDGPPGASGVGTDAPQEEAPSPAPPPSDGVADVTVPSSYDPGEPLPLVLVLHGLGSTGGEIREYLGVDRIAEERGFLVVHPDGSVDGRGNRFWDATDACCNFIGDPTGDADRLARLIADVSAEYAVDPDRVHVVGHSNGGFMAYRLACEHADLVASVASVSGATFADPAECTPTEPVSVLQVHGDADPIIRYDGGTFPGRYPGAVDTVTTWAGYAGCEPTPVDGEARDLDGTTAGAESPVTVFSGCPAGVSVELWSLPGTGHLPPVSAGFPVDVVDWLLEHPDE